MITLLRTTSEHTAFQALVAQLDQELAAKNGAENEFYAQFNSIDPLHHVVLAFEGEEAAGCGAMKDCEGTAMEIKRMYVPAALRGQGIAQRVLGELEAWVRELGYTRCVLETGADMPEPMGLYAKCGYQRIPNYGPYAGVAASACFEKWL